MTSQDKHTISINIALLLTSGDENRDDLEKGSAVGPHANLKLEMSLLLMALKFTCYLVNTTQIDKLI